jgi:hypothetical protein
MPEAVASITAPAGGASSGKFPPSTTAAAIAAQRWARPVKSAPLRRSRPLPENVVVFTAPAVSAEWPCPPHVMAMMHLVLQMDAERAAKAARQLAAIYALSGDAFTGMAIQMLEEVR